MLPAFHVDNFKPWVSSLPKPYPASKSHRTHCARNKSSALTLCDEPRPRTLPFPRHQLPARPPVDACVNMSAKVTSCNSSGSQIQPPQSSMSSSHTPPDAQYPEKAERSLDDHAGHASDSVTLRDGQDAINSPSDAPALQVAASSPSTPNSEQSAGLSDVHNDIPVDPMVLADGLWTIEELQMRPDDSFFTFETSCPYPDPPAVLCDTSVHHPDSNAHPKGQESNPRPVSPHGQGHMQNSASYENAEADRSSCDTPLVASTCGQQSKLRKRKLQELDGQPPKRVRGPMSGPKEYTSFPAFCTQFLSLSIDERLQFLSWLFEGALQRCVSEYPPTASKQGEGPAASRSTISDVMEQGLRGGMNVHGSSRKGMKWSAEESDLLLKLRKDEKRPWAEVTRLFSEEYPGRSRGAIQVYWSTALSKK
ncbi:hypothetical protein BDV40DRAFT_112331 [Aspergillus tamarii]|uniref:Myb-like domain-containing protein n=1 Tax=Aspergillus tamarii TaxID=41984 RepID=A0A5N6UAR4_ASPTM|nr:hypothetical protein BDV40DRAFT_112331 [Aspergillus tamarii]